MVAPFSLIKKKKKRKCFHVCLKCFFPKALKANPKTDEKPNNMEFHGPVRSLPDCDNPFIKALVHHTRHMENRLETRIKKLENKDEGEV